MNPLFGIAATAAQNPEVQNAAVGVGRAGINALGGVARGVGRGLGYVGEGITGNALQPAFNKLGDWGNQYLPAPLAGAGRWARNGLYGFGRALAGSEEGQGLWDTINGRNLPQQGGMGGMGGMGGGPMGAMGGGQGGMGGMGMGMNPEEMMQQQYMQQVQQPYNFDYANMQQNLINQHDQQLLPQLASRFAGNNNLDSSYFQRQAGGLRNDLLTRLGALQEQGAYNAGQLNQNRLGGIANYLNGQQQLGLGARRLGLDQTIAQRDNAYRNLGLMGNYGQAQQGADVQQLINALNAQGGLANLGMGAAFQPVHVGQGQSIGGQFLGPAMQGLGMGARLGANYMTGGGWEGVNKILNPGR